MDKLMETIFIISFNKVHSACMKLSIYLVGGATSLDIELKTVPTSFRYHPDPLL